MKPNTKIAIGITMAILLLAFIPTYDLFLKDKIDSVDVVVVKAGSKIEAKDTITKDNLSIEPRRKQDLVSNVIRADEMNTIIGYDAAELMVGNSMVSKNMIDFDNLIPDAEEGEAIRPIPEGWIYAKPGSLRRKDTIDIYVVDYRVVQEQPEQQEQANNVVSSDDKEKIEKNKEQLGLGKPILKDVKVVYAKDASNQEVTNTTEKKSDSGVRLNATGNISDLEIILNEEDFQLLTEHTVDRNAMLYITYN